jgi:hypothetical protein
MNDINFCITIWPWLDTLKVKFALQVDQQHILIKIESMLSVHL